MKPETVICPRWMWFALGGIAVVLAGWPQPTQAYITAPVQTIGQLCSWSTYVTEVRVEKISKEKGIIIYRKVRDLKGKYPRETIRHVFDLKNTPAHQGTGAVPVRPDETDWKYALDWAEVGKTAVVVALKYDPYGDFGHTYIDGMWYATMCPKRDWDLFYAIYSEPALLMRWHCGSPAQLVPGIEKMLAGKEAVLPVLVEGSKQELRQGRGKIKGLKVSLTVHDYNPQRDLVANWVDKGMVPSLIKSLKDANRETKVKAARELGSVGPEAKEAVPHLLPLAQGKDDELRTAALIALEQVGAESKPALPLFLAAIKEGDPLVRQSAIRALGKFGPQAKAALPDLETLLIKSEGADRMEIAEALVRIDSENKPALSILTAGLKDSSREMRIKTTEMLAQMGPAARGAIFALAEVVRNDGSGTVRMRAADALAAMGPDAKSARPALEAALADPRMAQRPEVLAKIKEVQGRLK